MRPYEGMFLLDSSGTNEELEGAIAALEGLLAKHGGQVTYSRKWGERRLIYEIGKHKKAHYQLVYFQLDPQAIAPMKRDLELTESVIRYFFLAHREVRFNELLERSKAQAERRVSEETAAAAEGEARREEAERARSAPEESVPEEVAAKTEEE